MTTGTGMGTGMVSRVDRFQRRHRVLSVPLAVIYKFFDEQGHYLAAIITYYAFIAIFPLMLLGSSILGFVLQGRPELQQELLDSALSQFPIIGDQLGHPDGLQGSVGAVVGGSLVSLYGALGLGQAIQNAQNVAWSVPRNSRPNPILLRLRSALLLLVVGGALVAISVASVMISSTDAFGSLAGSRWITWPVRILNVVVVGLTLTVLFRMAAARTHHFVRAAPGAFVVAVLWSLLQEVGARYVTTVLVGTSEMNQTFGLVLGLLGLIYIASVCAMVGITLNVVLARRLFPRALLTPFTDRVELTDADRRAYAGMAQAQRLKGFETVTVEFGPSPLEETEEPYQGLGS